MDEPTAEPTRRCTRCGRVKPRSAFAADTVRKDGRGINRRCQCRDCMAAYMREYTRERADFIMAYKVEHGCADCGYRESPFALQFDHRPGEVEVCGVHAFRVSGSWQQMLDEIAKCDVVCANCHAIRTHNRPPAMRNWDLKRRANEPAVLPLIHEDHDQLTLFT